jgi:hypothetical protein
MAIDKIQSESINLADNFAFTGTVTGASGTNTPAFEAYRNSNQSASHATATKIQADVEIYDSDSDYDKDTNYRFLPTTAGKYFCYMHVSFNGAANRDYYVQPGIYFNGASAASAQYSLDTNTGGDDAYTLYRVINFNGSSDYVEYYHYHHDYTASGSVNLLGINSAAPRTIIGAYRIIT